MQESRLDVNELPSVNKPPKIVVWDCDGTLTRRHTFQDTSIETLTSKFGVKSESELTREQLACEVEFKDLDLNQRILRSPREVRALMHRLMDQGVTLAVATFHDNKTWVKRLIDRLVKKRIDPSDKTGKKTISAERSAEGNFIIITNPNDKFITDKALSFTERLQQVQSKNHQLEEILRQVNADKSEAEQVQRDELWLIDDTQSNCEHARNAGFTAIQVHEYESPVNIVIKRQNEEHFTIIDKMLKQIPGAYQWHIGLMKVDRMSRAAKPSTLGHFAAPAEQTAQASAMPTTQTELPAGLPEGLHLLLRMDDKPDAPPRGTPK